MKLNNRNSSSNHCSLHIFFILCDSVNKRWMLFRTYCIEIIILCILIDLDLFYCVWFNLKMLKCIIKMYQNQKTWKIRVHMRDFTLLQQRFEKIVTVFFQRPKRLRSSVYDKFPLGLRLFLPPQRAFSISHVWP